MTVTVNGSQGLGSSGSGAIPAFSAYMNVASQTVVTTTFTKCNLGGEDFDTASAFDQAASYRFQPTVAGYYQVNGCVVLNASTALTQGFCGIYKNGALFKRGQSINTSGTTFLTVTVSAIIFLNGTTDYLELWGYVVGTGTCTFVGNTTDTTAFNGCLVRAV